MTKLAFIAASGIAVAMLGGCVIVDADVRDSDWDRSDYGNLYGAEVSPQSGEVTIVARSNGCTQKEDFRFVVRDRGEDTFDIGFRRERPDNCKALVPDGRRMTWTYAELGVPRNANLYVLNPVGR
ncbi:MAG: hypothetical protein ABMA14_18370 [Hyphomonadaceae bacterium]